MMIKVEHLETMGWEHSLRGMRNPLKSWDKSDSGWCENLEYPEDPPKFKVGKKDLELCLKLVKCGASHRKFLRHINIYCDITANLKFYDEFDTYLHVVKNSTSQMHGLGTKKFKFTRKSFSRVIQTKEASDTLDYVIYALNTLHDMYVDEKDPIRKKGIWRDMIELVPQSFLYTRTSMLNYEVFISMYFMRKGHKMIEWRKLMEQLRMELPYMNDFLTILENK